MHLKNVLSAALVTAAAAIAAIPGVASAQQVDGSAMVNASGRCVSALPAFETAIRKRPLALQNEGSSNAFVTCSFLGDGQDTGYYGIYIYARSTDGAAAPLSCTAALGFDNSPNVKYATVTVDVPASGEQAELAITGENFEPAGITSRLISVSCTLPPGIALNDTYLDYVRGTPPAGN